MHADWAALQAADFAPPAGAALDALVDEAFTLLASADPEQRDHLAYPALATWLEGGHLDGTLGEVGDRAAALLGATESHTRSFAALVLTEVVARDSVCRCLPPERLAAWQTAWAAWYTGERDLRGWVEGTGWIHALAHGADVAAALAGHPGLEAAEVRAALNTLLERLPTVTDLPTQWEEDRIALAAFLLLRRPELAADDVTRWLGGLEALWLPAEGPRPAPAAFAVQVARSLLVFAQLGAALPDGRVIPAPEHEKLAAPLLRTLRSAFFNMYAPDGPA